MKNNKKLTIITVCYNEENLEDTCKSIVNQTWQDFEWIVADGGSNSEIQKIWDKYKYRIDTFISERDNGVYDAMNKGIRLAKGEYLNFMNAGDYFHDDNVLENVFIENNYNADILCGSQIYIKHNNVLIPPPEKLYKVYFIDHYLRHQSTFIKRALFEKYGLYDEHYKITSDYEKFIYFYFKGASYKAVPYIVSDYAGGGLSSEVGNCDLRTKEYLEILDKYYSKKEITDVQIKKQLPKLKPFEYIFSVKNTKDKNYKVLTFLGFQKSFKNKN